MVIGFIICKNMANWISDRFLPFSLLHYKDDQYRFSKEVLPPRSQSPLQTSPQASSGGKARSSTAKTVPGNPRAMAGFHEQAVFDNNCRRMGAFSSLTSSDENMKNHDHIPVYDLDLVFHLLMSCLPENDVSFWAKTAHDHKLKASVTSADSLRLSFIRHVFDGDCVFHPGPECKNIVKSERWPHLMGIRMIDSLLGWEEQETLSLSEFVEICGALDIRSNAKRVVRTLRMKLVDRRRRLLDVVDAATLTIDGIFPEINGSPSVKVLNSISAAHNIVVSDENTKDETSANIIEHVTQGKCADSVDLAPGCERLIKDPAVQRENTVHLQIAVLQSATEVASKKQLCSVLDLHEIVYYPSDTIRKLRDRLRKYIRDIERGKLIEVEAEYDTIERLRRLDEVRKSWPTLVPPSVKEKIIKEFRMATSSAALSSFTCASCAQDMPIGERVRKECSQIDLDPLEGPACHWNDPAFNPPPPPFDSGPLKNKLVDKHGVISNVNGIILELCTACSRSLCRHKLPKFALANRLYTGPVPAELEDLTMVEECMIARARAKSWIVKLQEQETDSASPTAQRGLKGHSIIYPQQPDQVASVLPPAVDETLAYICVIFVGSSAPTSAWLRDKAKPLAVRRERVRKALQWLKVNNPLYRDVEISDNNLNTLPVDDVLPYHIEHVVADAAQETLTSRYDNVGEDVLQQASTHFESVVIADVDAHMPAKELRAAAVHHAKSMGKPFVQVAHGRNPVNEFANVDLFPNMYPTLYPYGCGGFEDKARAKRISMKAHAKYLFSLRDRRFQKHYSFLFTVFNILQRRALLLGCSLKVKKSSFSQFAQNFSSVSSDAVRDVLERIENGNGVTANTDEERRVLRLMKEVNLVTAKVPGSSAARVTMRNEIRALTMTHGMPSFYITINPADAHNPIVKFLAGADIDLDNLLENDIPKYWEQSILISSNPVVGAKFFNLYLKAFIRTVLGCRDKGTENDDGLLGRVKAHYGCVEAQGRGSLHCHMLIWIEGALNPNEIKEKVMENEKWGADLLSYLDDTITNVVPEDPIPDVPTTFDGKDPCTLRGVDLNIENLEERWGLRMKDVSRLAERVQRHRHSHTCYKYYKAGEARTCRFDLKEDNFRPESKIDSGTGSIHLRCLDGLVNNFNMTILEAVRCNMDIQFIGSGESAKAMIYYITDYITKSQLKSHIAYAALQVAVKKCEGIEDIDDDYTVRSKRLLQKCAYALVSHQELSGQQVASYLVGYEDHFTSHDFSCLYWASFERYVERYDSEKLLTKQITAENSTVDGTEELDEPGADKIVQDREDVMEEEAAGLTDEAEEVSIRVDAAGRVVALADQISDYTLRPTELETMCLWDFVAQTVKVYKSRVHASISTREPQGGGLNDDLNEDADAESGAESDDVGDVAPQFDLVGHGVRRGSRTKMEAYRFLPGHKEYDTKMVRIRDYKVVPVPIGPALPRHEEDTRARYSRLMLMLFKPWRVVSDLRDAPSAWETVLGTYLHGMNRSHRKIMENMQVLHECKDSRDDHMQTRTRHRAKGHGESVFGRESEEEGIEDVDMSEVLEHLEDIDRMSLKKQDGTTHETQECLSELTKAGFFSSLGGERSAGDDIIVDELLQKDDDTIEHEWRHTYDKRKDAWRQETGRPEAAEEDTNVMINSAAAIEQRDQEMALETRGAMPEEEGLETLGSSDVNEMANKWTLNKEQRRAFKIIAEHAAADKHEQLLMYLGGPGGTGKSTVVSAVRDFFEARKEQRRFRLAAYTGVAARNIGGATLHSMLQLNESGNGISAKTKRSLSAMWDGVDYLFIDEVSMIGCEMLHNVSRSLTEAKGNASAFGNVNIILAGDFKQLPPIGDTRLFKNVDTTSLGAASSKRAQGRILGRLLWLSFETVVMLQEMMRQCGDENAGFVSLLQRLRDGVCNQEDYDLLKGRCLGNHSSTKMADDWNFAPIIVTNNATRDAINRRAAEAFAEQEGKELYWYHAVDTHNKSKINDPALIEKLESQNSGQTKHRLRRIPLVIGMPVAINQNFDVAAGVVNGSQGILRKVRYFEDAEGLRHLKSCVVEIENADAVEMPHLPKHHFPILPDITDLKFEHNGSHKRCMIKRKQVPIEPGFAMTVHKAQGRTMERVIVDLAGCTGTEPPYVMASRAKSLNGLLVLRDFDRKQITKRRSEELRIEFKRLEILKWKAIAKYGDPDEVRDAGEVLKELQGLSSTKTKKRKFDGRATQEGVSKKRR